MNQGYYRQQQTGRQELEEEQQYAYYASSQGRRKHHHNDMYSGGGGGAATTTASAPAAPEAQSAASGRSSRQGSAVMARARQFDRVAEENRTRARSLERNKSVDASEASSSSRGRSHSAGRYGGAQGGGNRVSTRERAMASVQNDATRQHQHQLSPQRQRQQAYDASPPRSHQSAHRHSPEGRSPPPPQQERSVVEPRHVTRQEQAPPKAAAAVPNQPPGGGGGGGGGGEQAIVTPELLVDALSGHEDGLLAIAERLMEHYDAGYDAMGEAIIDAFADVQKLFQHVVEAAHMEGAAFEASRREEEVERLREAAAAGGGGRDDSLDSGGAGPVGGGGADDYGPARRQQQQQGPNASNNNDTSGGGAGAASRHDEFIDEDVRDVLTDAIRRGRTLLRDSNDHAGCYALYEKACNSASSLLPVDSDHRGRLQLSIARAESMSADRACAILKYAMDDVLRSGLNAGGGGAVGPDPSKRGDCVLTRPAPVKHGALAEDEKSIGGEGGEGGAAVAQSSEEALASLVEEMKEVLGAPVYENTPLQGVAARFWEALGEAQRSNVRTEERLEHKLAALKAEYLIAREEWDEKLNAAKREYDALRQRYHRLVKESDESSQIMEQARKALANGDSFEAGRNGQRQYVSPDPTFDSTSSPPRGMKSASAASVASFGSGLAQHAKSLVGSLSCVGIPSEKYGASYNENDDSSEGLSRSRGRVGHSRSNLSHDEENRFGSRSRKYSSSSSRRQNGQST